MIFYRWWLIISITAIIFLFSISFGYFQQLPQLDKTYLSYACLVLFVLSSLFIGVLSWQPNVETLNKHLPLCWFTSELMLGLGMIGTLIGFMLMITGAFASGSLDMSNAENARTLLINMATGFSTAAVTTLVGLSCSLITKLQLINLEYALPDER
ncbi:MAG: hypothetical protein N2235_08455 [Fischerella sp.]|nr:hypothetical protein [Fischerella sp.]